MVPRRRLWYIGQWGTGQTKEVRDTYGAGRSVEVILDDAYVEMS